MLALGRYTVGLGGSLILGPQALLHLLGRCVVCFSFCLIVVGKAQDGGPGNAQGNDYEKQLNIFFQLLQHYNEYPELRIQLSQKELESFEEITLRYLQTLDRKVMEARFEQYNLEFLQYSRLLTKVQKEQQETEKRLDELPLSDPKRRLVEYSFEAQKNQRGRIEKFLFFSSVNANNSILSAIETFDVASKVKEKEEQEQLIAAKPTDMPGVQGYSRQERLRQDEASKINLMPVDDDFYGTDLGKKLEEDLAGRADYWSYDYEKDELYVKVGETMGKLTVRQDRPGVRFVQTRVGSDFSEPVGAAMKVDLFRARGRFLTGDKNEETLFGPMPDSSLPLAEEPGKAPHSEQRAPSDHSGQ